MIIIPPFRLLGYAKQSLTSKCSTVVDGEMRMISNLGGGASRVDKSDYRSTFQIQ
jgi:hypothetical protein